MEWDTGPVSVLIVALYVFAFYRIGTALARVAILGMLVFPVLLGMLI